MSKKIKPTIEQIETEIEALKSKTKAELQELWHKYFDHKPAQYHRDFMTKRIAYEMRAKVHGRLPATALNKLKRLAYEDQKEVRGKITVSAGTKLVRDWNGTGERIRDKFRASKEKGMWMGGYIPLGYNVDNRKLLINEKEAELVKYIFEEYLKLGSVYKLQKKLETEGYRNKSWITADGKTTGGGPLSKMALYGILGNPVYIGKVAHKNKGKVYNGQHPAIIEERLFNAVQKKITSYRAPNSGEMQATNYLLQGKCFDINNKPFTTTYTKKLNNSKSYGYYHNVHSKHRISKVALDKVVIQAIQSSLVEEGFWLEFLSNSPHLHSQQLLHKLQQIIWNFNALPQSMQVSIGKQIVYKVTILNSSIVIRVSKNLDALASHEFASQPVAPPIGDLTPDLNIAEDYLEITVPISFRQI